MATKRIPNIPDLPAKLPVDMNRFLAAIKEGFDVLVGRKGDTDTRMKSYFGDVSDLDKAGNWRIHISGDDLHIEKRIGNTWVLQADTLQAYAAQYLHEAAVNVDISAAGQGVYVKIINLNPGPYKNVAISASAFTILHPGVYRVEWDLSGDSAGNNKTYEVDLFVNGVEQEGGSARKEFGATGSLGGMTGSTILELYSPPYDIDFRMKEPGAGAGTDFDIYHANFNIFRIGATQ